MESVTITQARRPSRSQVNPSFSGALPGFPTVDKDWMEYDDSDSLPLPDHFPEPYVDPAELEEKKVRSSVTLEAGATLVFCPPPATASPSPTAGSSSQKAVTSSQTAVTSSRTAMTSSQTAVSTSHTAVTSSQTPMSSSPTSVTSSQTVVSSSQTAVTSFQTAVTSSHTAVTLSCTAASSSQPAVVASCTQPSAIPSVRTSRAKPPATYPKPLVTSCTNSGEGRVEAKEGIKRITDKYATPNSLLKNSSASDPQPSAHRHKETLPSSPTPSITLTPSPSFTFPHGARPPMNSTQTKDPVDVSSTHGTLSASSSSGSAARPDSGGLRLPAVPKRGSSQSLSTMSVSALSDVPSDMPDSPGSVALRDSVFTSSLFRSSGLLGTSRYQSVSGIPLTASLGDGVTDQDVQQVEMFYRSHKSEVTVCRCLANLYLGSSASKLPSVSTPTSVNGRVPSSTYSDLWEFVTTGIPLLVQDSGDHRRSQRVSIVLAEKGTGFVLWKDTVTSHSHYSCPDSNFHKLTLSSDASKLVGLSFDDSKAAAEFGARITQLTSEFGSDSGTLVKKGKRKKKQQEGKKKMKFKSPKKTDISRPCCFQHITKLERPQITGVMPLPPNSFLPPPSGSVSGLSDILRDRLSVSSRTHSYSSGLSEASTLVSEH